MSKPTHHLRFLTLATLTILCLLLPSVVKGERSPDTPEEKQVSNRKNLVVAPWVLSSPSFGNGGGLISLYFYRPQAADTTSPPSTFSLLGAYSDTDSYFATLINQNFFNQDHWRLTSGLIRGEINNELDIDELGRTEFTTELNVLFLRSLWRVYGDWFLGGQANFSSVSFREGNEASKDYFVLYGVGDSDSVSLGLAASYDTRDHQRYPHSGTLAELVLSFHPEDFGADETYHVLDSSINRYQLIVPGQVLALRGYGRFTPSDTPYSGLSNLGRRSDLRGYTTGENVAENLISAQAEYRWMFTKRWGVVGFAGVAGLYDGGLRNFNSNSIFTNGGAGLRYLLNPENRVNFRVDYAFGQDDEDGFYVSLREAF